MRRLGLILALAILVTAAHFVEQRGFGAAAQNAEALWHHRNLGKAFYENPTTQVEAVTEFKKALDLAPQSARERINYGLALLRAGKTEEGITELEKAQKQEPSIPHTWFNLGIALKRASEYDRAVQQLERMAQMVPDEPITHYNLGVLYKVTGRQADAIAKFEKAESLDPNLAGPHFQLYNAYRQADRKQDAARELAIFQEIKKRTAGAAVPEDMEWSFYSEIYDPVEAVAAAKPAAVSLKARQLGKGLDPATANLLVLDSKGAQKADLLAWSAAGVTLYSAGKPVADPVLSGLRGVLAIAAGDYDNDGLPDLAVIGGKGVELLHNDKGKFSAAALKAPAGSYRAALWLDYDHDYDLDLLLLGSRGTLLRNNGEAGFSDQSKDFPFTKGMASAAAIFELIADTTSTDVIVAYEDRPGVLYRDKLAGKYVAEPLPALPKGMTSLLPYDMDNDSFFDLVAWGTSGTTLIWNRQGKLEAGKLPDGAAGPVTFADLENRGSGDLIASGSLYRNLGLGKFSAPTSQIPKSAAFASADFNVDGLPDIAAVSTDGSLQVLDNRTATANRWLSVSLAGVKNLKLAEAAEVEVKAGSLYQKRLYSGFPLHFGLGAGTTADTARITWPNGLIQNETRQPAGKVQVYKEAQRLSGSCPMIYTWNGVQFEFITDVLGVAPLGASSGDGKYFPVDHDEYIQVPGRALVPENGELEVRITEELREVSYLDQIRLIALDHPAQTTVVTNEKFKGPPFPVFRLFEVRGHRRPRSARDGRGKDVLDRVLRTDQRYADTFQRNLAGVAEKHILDLDFGRPAHKGTPAVLILNGWVDWADGSTFRGAAQESKQGLIFPYLQVKDSKGRWRTVIEDMGIPAGKPKTMAVDLTDKFLSASREVRIVTNLCVYWDEIYLSENAADPAVRLTPLELAGSRLRFRGFSRPVIHPERKQPETFRYHDWMPVSMWNPTPGMYTRFGDVRELISTSDDQLVIMGSGDELQLRFKATGLPDLPEGWTRDYLIYVDGWAKDADANTAYSQTVDPLPFHAMPQYPYAGDEHFPMTELQRKTLIRPALRLLQPLSLNRGR